MYSSGTSRRDRHRQIKTFNLIDFYLCGPKHRELSQLLTYCINRLHRSRRFSFRTLHCQRWPLFITLWLLNLRILPFPKAYFWAEPRTILYDRQCYWNYHPPHTCPCDREFNGCHDSLHIPSNLARHGIKNCIMVEKNASTAMLPQLYILVQHYFIISYQRRIIFLFTEGVIYIQH